MSRFFPTAAYAEDQPLAHTILASHVLHRGFQAGAFVGLLIGATAPAASSLYTRVFKSTASNAAATTAVQNNINPVTAIPPRLRSIFPTTTNLLKSVGRGTVGGTALLTVGLIAQMRGKEQIEWADRSWRLLRNEGQVEVDDWSLVGTAAGAVFAARQVGSRAILVLGGAGLGNVLGVGGYMAWRYGMMKGKR